MYSVMRESKRGYGFVARLPSRNKFLRSVHVSA
jgi:hypothetical protein